MTKPHKHADLIKAWADGAVIQYENSRGDWLRCMGDVPSWSASANYRIKPESKPDVVMYTHINQAGVRGARVLITSEHNWNQTGMPAYTSPANSKLTFDGETGNLKSIEMIG